MFDRVEVKIRGFKGDKVVSYDQMWTYEDLMILHPQIVQRLVSSKIGEIMYAMKKEEL